MSIPHVAWFPESTEPGQWPLLSFRLPSASLAGSLFLSSPANSPASYQATAPPILPPCLCLCCSLHQGTPLPFFFQCNYIYPLRPSCTAPSPRKSSATPLVPPAPHHTPPLSVSSLSPPASSPSQSKPPPTTTCPALPLHHRECSGLK